MTAPRLLPADDDLDTGPFFQAAANHELVIQRCNGCDAVLHVPRAYCSSCGGWDSRWERSDGKAHLYSWTVVTHQVHPAYPTPCTVLLVKLDGTGANLIGSMPGTPDLEVDQPMELWFEDLDGATLPNWRPAPPAA